MVKVREDLTGKVFGRLTVIKQAEDYVSPKGVHLAMWSCRCQCGEEKDILQTNLIQGHIVSCGCYHKEQTIKSSKKHNDYVIRDRYVIFYTINNEPFLVDIEDFGRVSKHYWYKVRNYFRSVIKGKTVSLHRYIINCPDDKVVDHKGGTQTTFDNRKSNLRIVTQMQNTMNSCKPKNNTSGFTGVSWSKAAQKWTATIRACGRNHWLGVFTNKDDAIAARKDAEEKYFGEYSHDNSRGEYNEFTK